MSDWRAESTGRVRIGLYGNFGAGNLGNECTLQAIIEQIRRHRPNAEIVCFCKNPEDVRRRHGIAAVPSGAIDRAAAARAGSRGLVGKMFRFAFRWLPLELDHAARTLRVLNGLDMFVVAGTGIIADYLTGPRGWPYEIFKLSALARLCRAKLMFFDVGVGPILHPASRWFIRNSFGMACHRSYRDQASKDYMAKIGFDTGRDRVFPDVVFGLSKSNLGSPVQAGRKRVIGIGIKDHSLNEPKAFQAYLDTMGAFVSWLQGRGYAVRLLIGDMQYDTGVIRKFVEFLKGRQIAAEAPLLLSEPAQSVDEILRQVGETDVVISARYHNLVMALIQDKPIIALSDHAKLSSLASDFGLAQYLVPLENLQTDTLIDRFERLEADLDRLSSHVAATSAEYRHAVDGLFSSVFGPEDSAGTEAACSQVAE